MGSIASYIYNSISISTNENVCEVTLGNSHIEPTVSTNNNTKVIDLILLEQWDEASAFAACDFCDRVCKDIDETTKEIKLKIEKETDVQGWDVTTWGNLAAFIHHFDTSHIDVSEMKIRIKELALSVKV
jgi:hypothetical protein